MDELKDEVICSNCVGEPYLKAEIGADGVEGVCRYCGHHGKAFTLEEMADRIAEAFSQHYQRTPEEPDSYQRSAMNDPESPYDWYREGEETSVAIMNAAEIPEAAASDIQELLDERHSDFEAATMGEETEFSDDAHYEEIMPDDEEWREGWRNFERSIKTEARFFSQTAAEQLAALFDDIDKLRTRSGRPLLVEAGPATDLTHLFRARVFQSDAKLEAALMRPDVELAAPPSRHAAVGRMNAKGISTFYGATKAEIALAEVRPPVGAQVAVARFNISRSLKLLDLNALEEIHVSGSIFDPKYARALGRMMFLRSLCRRIARPVMPDDQDTEYLPTQAVADYLATQSETPLDGIMFPSVQADGEGHNVVLFHKASRCVEIEIPADTEMSARTGQMYEEGWEREYVVVEEVPEKLPVKPLADTGPLFFQGPARRILPWGESDERDPALEVDLKSIRVHVITAVTFAASEHSVTRYRWAKTVSPM
ncbi:MAG: RES domain-containing protein [Devosia sp.]|nr:RES domain-containing protein [Devosia sp.]